MDFKLLMATVTVAAVAIGLILPAPHSGRIGFQARHSQIAQIDVAR